MNQLLLVLITALSGYGLFEMFIMAVSAQKERRPLIIVQIGAGFAFCIWLVLDKSFVSWPVCAALVFLTADRLQTRLMGKRHERKRT
jgi:hypothetical protein